MPLKLNEMILIYNMMNCQLKANELNLTFLPKQKKKANELKLKKMILNSTCMNEQQKLCEILILLQNNNIQIKQLCVYFELLPKTSSSPI